MSVPVRPTGGGQIDPVELRAMGGNQAAADEIAGRQSAQADADQAWAKVEKQTLEQYRWVCGEFSEAFRVAREAIAALAVAGWAVDVVVEEFTLRSRTEKPGWAYLSYSTPSACGHGVPHARPDTAILAAAAPVMGTAELSVDVLNEFRAARQNYRLPRPGGE